MCNLGKVLAVSLYVQGEEVSSLKEMIWDNTLTSFTPSSRVSVKESQLIEKHGRQKI